MASFEDGAAPSAKGVDVAAPPTKVKVPPPPPPPPKERRCHICGQLQLIGGYKSHYKSCLKLWLEEEALKPKEEQRPVPPEPPLPGGQELTDLTDDADLQEFNAQAMIIWKEKALERCPHCGRSFHPKALELHRRGCQAVPDGYAYPTVLTAVRSVRRGRAPVRVSEAGPVRLDQRRVEARRVVRGAWEASDAFPLAEAKAAAAAERDDRAVRRHAPRANHRARTDDFVPSATVRRTFSETAFKLAETERGRVSRHELHAVLERHPHLSDVLGLPRAADAASLALALAPLSADAAARIVQQSAFEKLVALRPSPSREVVKSAACRTLFNLADRESPKGTVTENELLGAVRDRPELCALLGAEPGALGNLFSRIDTGRGGRVNFLEFEAYVQAELGDDHSSRAVDDAPPPPEVTSMNRFPNKHASLTARDLAPARAKTAPSNSAGSRRALERVRAHAGRGEAQRSERELSDADIAGVLRRVGQRLGEAQLPEQAPPRKREGRQQSRDTPEAPVAVVDADAAASEPPAVGELLSRLDSRLARLEGQHGRVLAVMEQLNYRDVEPRRDPAKSSREAEWGKLFGSHLARFE